MQLEVYCGAKTRRGTPCKGKPMSNGRCRMHGGSTPSGIASPQFKHGRYLPYLQPALTERYKALSQDDDLLNLQSEITLVDVLLTQNLERLETGESGEFWDKALGEVVKARKAYKGEDYGGLEQALDELEALCDGRRLHFAAEKEIREKIDLRRKLTESRRKHLIEAEQVLTTEQAMVLVSGLLESVRRNVTDRTILTAIQTDFIRLTTARNGGEDSRAAAPPGAGA